MISHGCRINPRGVAREVVLGVILGIGIFCILLSFFMGIFLLVMVGLFLVDVWITSTRLRKWKNDINREEEIRNETR